VSKLTQVMAAARRFAVWLLPAGRWDWLAALWAEAHEVPPGLTRLAWRAGGVWVLARGALMPRRLVRVGLFAAASAGAGWVAWPQLGVGHVAEGRFNAIAPVLVLAVLPLLSRRFFGTASPGRIGGSLRVLCYAANLALLSAWTFLLVFSSLLPVKPAYQRIFCNDRCTGVPGRSSGGPTWQAEILIMLLILGYAGVTLFLTSRRSQVTRSTLAIGTGTGLLFGVVMYAVDPLGLSKVGHQPMAAGLDGRPSGGAGLDPAVRRPGRGRRAGRAAVPRTRWLQAARPRQNRAGRCRRRAGERDRRDGRHYSRHGHDDADAQVPVAAALAQPRSAPDRVRHVPL